MNFRAIPLILFCASLSFTHLHGQTCTGSAPINFTVTPDLLNLGQCYFTVDWGPSILGGELPALTCGSPGLPPIGSNIPLGLSLDNFSVTIDGSDVLLYDKGGIACMGATSDLKYGLLGNTYTTDYSSTQFCLALLEESLLVDIITIGGANYNCSLSNSDTPAPIELLYFEGKVSENKNTLFWGTSSQENVAAFVVEKSTDGKRNIQTIANIANPGNSKTVEHYKVEDTEPHAQTYYRLRSIDFDGSSMDSEWITIERPFATGSKLLELTPVPLGDQPLEVVYQTKSDERVVLHISDINGRKLWEETKTLETGIHRWSIDLPESQQNLLVLQIQTKDEVISRLVPREKGF